MDVLLNLRNEFETFYHNLLENEKKKIVWIQECGRITIDISGVSSVFSEMQASIILTLGRSFRPMKSDQLSEVLEYGGPSEDVSDTLGDLSEGGILSFNPHSRSYEINYENLRAYEFVAKKK